MNESERLVQVAVRTKNRAEELCNSKLMRDAADLFRRAGYEDQAEKCEAKADRWDGE